MNFELLSQLLTGWLLLSILPFSFRRWSSQANLAPFIIPAIIAIGGAIGSWLKGRAANKSVEEQTRLYNEYLAARQAGVQDIIGHLSARGVDIYGPQTSTRSGTSTTQQQSTTQQSQQPFITAAYSPLEKRMREIVGGRLALETAPIAGAAEQRARDINQTFASALSGERNRAARTGVKPLASDVNSRRAGALASVLPDVERERRGMQTEDLGLASALTSAFGRGTSGTSSTSGSGTTSEFGTSTTPPNLSALAALLLPPGPQAGGGKQSLAGQGVGDASSILAWLWQQGAFKSGSGSSTDFTGV